MKEKHIYKNGRLKRKDNTVVFIDHDDRKVTLPVEQLDALYIYGEVDFNSKLFSLIGKYNVFIHIFDYYKNYSGCFAPRRKHVSGYVDVKQSQYYLDHQKRLYLAKMFLDGAAHHINRNLRRNKEQTADFIKKIEVERFNILQSNQIPEMMGAEGRIRKSYYQAFNHLISSSFFRFQKREKLPPTDPINALISFGNSQLYATIIREIHQTTLNPTISYLHEPSHRRYSLSLDLAEIFKPFIIDPLILKLINNRMIRENHFDQVDQTCLLSEEGSKIFLTAYNKKLKETFKHRKLNRKVSYRELIKLECYKLIKHLIEDEIYKPFKAWW